MKSTTNGIRESKVLAWEKLQERAPGIFLPVETRNPGNGSHGNHYAEAARKKKLRQAAFALCRGRVTMADRLTVTLTRYSSGVGLDPFDNLPAALKPVVDGVADALGLKNDRDPRVTWVAKQEKCPRGCRGVRVEWELSPAAA